MEEHEKDKLGTVQLTKAVGIYVNMIEKASSVTKLQ